MELPTDEEFENIIAAALDELPEKYIANLKNVVVTYADEPSEEQRKKLKLPYGQSLFGLYEGVPLTQRVGRAHNGVAPAQLPDKITLFKLPLYYHANGNFKKFKDQVKHTLWHEIAHYFGLDHNQIERLESKRER